MPDVYQRTSREQGLTLIEIMVVIAIIAIAAAIAVPSYNDTVDRQRLTQALETTLSDIRWAKSESVKRSLEVSVTFSTGANWSYTIMDANSTLLKTASNADFSTISLNSTGFASNTLAFNPARGTANAGNVELTSARGHTGKVTVSSLGRSRICNFGGYEACP